MPRVLGRPPALGKPRRSCASRVVEKPAGGGTAALAAHAHHLCADPGSACTAAGCDRERARGFRGVLHELTRPHFFARPIRRGSRAKYRLQREGRFSLSSPRCAWTRPLARCAGTGADKPPLRPRVCAVRQRPAPPSCRRQPGWSGSRGLGREPTLAARLGLDATRRLAFSGNREHRRVCQPQRDPWSHGERRWQGILESMLTQQLVRSP